MRLNGKSLLIGVAISFCTSWLWAQENDKTLKLGFNYGVGSQANFPFNDPDYSFDSEYYKVQLTYRLTGKGRWNLELNVEPSLYISEYHVLIPYSGQVYRRLGYLDPRMYPGDTKMEEYALNFGLISRFRVIEAISVYVRGIVRPQCRAQQHLRRNRICLYSQQKGSSRMRTPRCYSGPGYISFLNFRTDLFLQYQTLT